MMSFHLPPIAARAAVSGHPLMALRRAGREWLPKGAILIIFMVAKLVSNHSTTADLHAPAIHILAKSWNYSSLPVFNLARVRRRELTMWYPRSFPRRDKNQVV